MKDSILGWMVEQKFIINEKFNLEQSPEPYGEYELVFYLKNFDRIVVTRFNVLNVSTIDIHFDTVSAFITFKGISQ